MPSRIIKLVPIQTNELLPAAIKAEAVNSYAPPLDTVSRQILRGIKPESIPIIFPRIIGVSADSPNFLEKVEEWYNELTVKVPADGRDFEMGIEDTPVEVAGRSIKYPINCEEFVIGSIISNDNNIAKTVEQIENGNLYRYKLIDIAKEKERKEQETVLSLDAMTVVTRLAVSDEFVPVIKQGLIINKVALNLSLKEVDAMSNIEAKGALQLLLNKNPKAVIETYKNNDLLEDIAIVHKLMESGTLRMIGTDIYHLDDKVAPNIKEAALVLRDDTGFKETLLSKHSAAMDLV